MSGLVLNLRPWETFLVGTHLLQNGPKKAQIHVRDDQAGVLRLRDALHPDEVTTPLTRLYYAAQLLVLEPAKHEQGLKTFLGLLSDTREALPSSPALVHAERWADAGQFFRVLRCLKPLLPAESLLLSQTKIREECDHKLCMTG